MPKEKQNCETREILKFDEDFARLMVFEGPFATP